MRELLFRGKRVDNDEFIIGDSLMQFENFDPAIWLHKEGWTDVIYETIGLYTDLTDKNGTKIFEGDILKLTADNGDTTEAEVRFGEYCLEDDDEDEGHIGFYLSVKADDETYNYGLAQIRVYRDYVEVVGNIYDK